MKHIINRAKAFAGFWKDEKYYDERGRVRKKKKYYDMETNVVLLQDMPQGKRLLVKQDLEPNTMVSAGGASIQVALRGRAGLVKGCRHDLGPLDDKYDSRRVDARDINDSGDSLLLVSWLANDINVTAFANKKKK